MFINQNKDYFYTKLAFQQAEINLGSTGPNPSVGCVIVKNNSVISVGRTSQNGRPHAETNALKKKLDYKNSDLYVTLEPCSHYGKTPPCINKIITKKIKRVIFAINDIDPRSRNKAFKNLKKKKIIVKRFINKKLAEIFYESYFLKSKKKLPLVDAKLAISKDNFTINKKKKWITNIKSRNIGNFLRSKYDCLLSTAETINNDNSQLDCRIEGLEKKTPVLIILDRYLKIKKNLKLFKYIERKIFIFTHSNNIVKENFFKNKGVKILKFNNSNDHDFDFKRIFYNIKMLGFSRVFVETGSTFLSQLLKLKLIKNLYLFKSSNNLSTNGSNKTNLFNIKKIKLFKKNRVNINLKEDSLYKIKL